ncbi:MAG: VOC family protein [Acidimicrobiales bacterium]
MQFLPYLNFDGNCREAFTRYHEILGGTLEVMGSDDGPDGDVPAEFAGRVLHAALVLDDGAVLMASDVQAGGDWPGVHGMYTYLGVPTIDDAQRVFHALADGGEVEMPIEPAFFSPMFGVCRDRFGTNWMISADPED